MIALYDDERRLLLQSGVLLICGACAVLPFTMSPSSVAVQAQELPVERVISAPVVPGRLRFPEVSVEHDPFIPDESAMVTAPVPASAGDDDAIGVVLPPNAGASDGAIPPPSTTSTAVRAIVLGDQSRALIETNGTVRVVAVGDAIGNDTVRSIDASGITLSNGVRLTLTVPK